MIDITAISNTMEIKVRISDTNAMGYVHANHYFIYFDEAFVSLLSAFGSYPAEHIKRGVVFPVVESTCTYKRPARFGDLLEIVTTVEKTTGHSLTCKHMVYRKGDRAFLAEGVVARVCYSLEGCKVALATVLAPRKTGGGESP